MPVRVFGIKDTDGSINGQASESDLMSASPSSHSFPRPRLALRANVGNRDSRFVHKAAIAICIRTELPERRIELVRRGGSGV